MPPTPAGSRAGQLLRHAPSPTALLQRAASLHHLCRQRDCALLADQCSTLFALVLALCIGRCTKDPCPMVTGWPVRAARQSCSRLRRPHAACRWAARGAGCRTSGFRDRSTGKYASNAASPSISCRRSCAFGPSTGSATAWHARPPDHRAIDRGGLFVRRSLLPLQHQHRLTALHALRSRNGHSTTTGCRPHSHEPPRGGLNRARRPAAVLPAAAAAVVVLLPRRRAPTRTAAAQRQTCRRPAGQEARIDSATAPAECGRSARQYAPAVAAVTGRAQVTVRTCGRASGTAVRHRARRSAEESEGSSAEAAETAVVATVLSPGAAG